jgi:hypothetical protein
MVFVLSVVGMIQLKKYVPGLPFTPRKILVVATSATASYSMFCLLETNAASQR